MIWRRAIHCLCKPDGKTLRQPITNQWTPYGTHHRKWNYLYDPLHLLIHDTTCHTTYRKGRSQHRNHHFYLTNTTPLHPNCVLVNPQQKDPALLLLAIPTPVTEYPAPSHTVSRATHTIQVSDGLVINGDGTYGWVKATSNDIIERDYGAVTENHHTSSYQAEAQGVADSLFLALFQIISRYTWTMRASSQT